MDTFIKADIFFLISTLAVILVAVSIGYVAYKIIMIIRRVERFLGALESRLKDAGDEVSGLVADLRERISKLPFLKRRSRTKSK